MPPLNPLHRLALWLAVAFFCLAGPARAEQTRVRSEHFSFTVRSERVAIANELASRADATLGEVARQLGVGGADDRDIFAPISVRIAHDDAEFEAAMPNRQNIEWAAGVAFPQHGVVVLRIDERTRFNIADVFRHELSHIVLGRASRGADVPSWFVEGLAVHQAGEQIAERWQRAADATLTESLPPLALIANGFPADGTAADFAYAQSTAFVSFLLDRAGWAGLRTVVAGLRQGRDFETAFRGAYGATTMELEAQFREKIAKSASWIAVVLGSSVLTAVAGLLFIGLAWRKRRLGRARMTRMADPLDDEFA